MNKNELLSFLNQIGARPKKGLSQNFLIDQNILKKIVELAEVGSNDAVLEIGPGPGALTQALLNTGASVTAIEKDRIFADHLCRFQTKDQNLTAICDDILEFPFNRLESNGWKVVANLPYHITTPILEKLCNHAHLFHSVTIMVQKEVADRIKAIPKTKAFGSLTLFLQFYTQLRGSFLVAPGSFYPEPGVDSTVLRLDFRKPPDVNPNTLFPLIRRAFQQRRKMLTSSLKGISSLVAEALISLNISSKARPEELSLNEWIAFHNYILSDWGPKRVVQ